MSTFLRSLLDAACEGLEAVGWRRMFGCDAAFAGGAIFALVWKTGRVGVKLPDGKAFAAAMALAGAEPWAPGGKPMSHWVLLPESLHDDEEELAVWVRRAHALALAAGPPEGKAKPKPGAKATPKAAPKATTQATKKPAAADTSAQRR